MEPQFTYVRHYAGRVGLLRQLVALKASCPDTPSQLLKKNQQRQPARSFLSLYCLQDKF